LTSGYLGQLDQRADVFGIDFQPLDRPLLEGRKNEVGYQLDGLILSPAGEGDAQSGLAGGIRAGIRHPGYLAAHDDRF
jgi:hypothetical protein